jgi:hypothetical protein
LPLCLASCRICPSSPVQASTCINSATCHHQFKVHQVAAVCPSRVQKTPETCLARVFHTAVLWQFLLASRAKNLNPTAGI